MADKLGLIGPAMEQPEYNLFNRKKVRLFQTLTSPLPLPKPACHCTVTASWLKVGVMGGWGFSGGRSTLSCPPLHHDCLSIEEYVTDAGPRSGCDGRPAFTCVAG